ncbi:hypothetical protein [Stieleria varia]|uniref:PEP-CTERM protein-sorting domain-containing protein n=1 Tax=Stieleria varia TaxID=2528005 RepID=A0A5C5ZM00_9BACT|nr:hypothetical protein [Stieleria varia]TWT87861.1 hypothetical protein Pla52n_69680 [Stieleria varia]
MRKNSQSRNRFNHLPITAGIVLVVLGIWTPAAAGVITSMQLSTNGSSQLDAIDSFAFNDDQDLGRFWTFAGTMGDSLTLSVMRSEPQYDPYVWLFEGAFTDTSEFGGGASSFIDSGDPGFLGFFDDGGAAYAADYILPGEFTYDVQFTLSLPTSGTYTAIVTSFNSGDDGGDGFYDYQISANVSSAAVPEPSSVWLIAGAIILCGRQHRRKRR